MHRNLNRLLVLAAALLFSTGGAVIKTTSLNSWQVAGFRSAVAAAALLLLLPGARSNWNARVLLTALPYAATLMLFVAANKFTTSANAIFLQSTAPLYLLVLGPWLLHERLRRVDVLLAAAVGCGMALFFVGVDRAVQTAPDPARGNLLAVASGATWALTIAGLRHLARGRPEAGIAAVAAGNLTAALLSLPLALPVIGATAGDWAAIAYLGVFQIGLAYVCLTRAMRVVPAFEAGTLLLLEPALNPVWAYFVHGERPGGWAIAGGAVILGATLANSWWQSRGEPVRR